MSGGRLRLMATPATKSRAYRTRSRTAARRAGTDGRPEADGGPGVNGRPGADGGPGADGRRVAAEPRHTGGAGRPRATGAAAVWAAVFGAFHVHWALGGTAGLGEGVALDGLSGGMLVYDLVVAGLCFLGAWTAAALGRTGRPYDGALSRRLLLTAAWAAAVLLVARGGAGVADDLLRTTGALTHGLSGMTVEEVYGEPRPSAVTLWSMRAVDAYFLLGGLLFARAASRTGRAALEAGGTRG
ncbi:DUF3995 domain-containing protein [Streptomyces lycii]|uniref:DUF3995 domain-containing protein n=1 Tax=Streptomyces lycii TaxID=2654337 RepID=A0ABQ7FKM5_9ACTN|nr:DUF3995 domain-containing protein [Streptomyces lycii]